MTLDLVPCCTGIRSRAVTFQLHSVYFKDYFILKIILFSSIFIFKIIWFLFDLKFIYFKGYFCFFGYLKIFLVIFEEGYFGFRRVGFYSGWGLWAYIWLLLKCDFFWFSEIFKFLVIFRKPYLDQGGSVSILGEVYKP